MRAQFTVLLSLLALAPTITKATECTDAEAAYADSVWAAAANTSACSPYVTQTDPVYVNAPCTATDCVTVVESVAKDLPDCTFSGINNKIEVQNALTECNGGDVKDAGSLTFSSSSSQADGSTMLSSSTASSSGLISGSKGSSSSFDMSSSSGSITSGSTVMAPSAASGTGMLPSGDQSNNILGSSNSKSGSSAAGPRVHEGKLHFWVVSTLVAGVVVAFSS
ncbi:hypothetical protein PHYSODRAFT_336050 [Phytophthora sojae]|uniref:Elicitin-like protein n=2 Tax=Phytophthora sojae TaxID=67593 RepID=G4ZVR9_PHYSP|nr:hypothetical protein PHYSODRAFT_336050 [Phytophthora sojae]ABB56017.1 elicitin-like protein SOL13J [Phytophthora sojae]EGZ11533.1 hypothetical protein PHYSODRAFT_336050 [Phytophthora sojae]|eukprot:XP_009531866.1 hypothetical protein PHYSODRAFT_336050 [Phytophthora sojae]